MLDCSFGSCAEDEGQPKQAFLFFSSSSILFFLFLANQHQFQSCDSKSKIAYSLQLHVVLSPARVIESLR
jgi:hypothetical protein